MLEQLKFNATAINTTGYGPANQICQISGTPTMSGGLIEFDIDVKPGSDPNCISINSHSVVPVAILGSDTFDMTLVEHESPSFGSMAVRVRGNIGPFCGVE